MLKIANTNQKKKELKVENKIKIKDENKKKINENIITAIIEIKNCNLKYRIINSYENIKKQGIRWDLYKNKTKENEDELKNCEIYINDTKIDFNYYYKFPSNDIYIIKYKFNQLLKSANFMFYDCSSFISLDLSNFNTKYITHMGFMFYGCKSLKSLNLSNVNTENVTNMGYMFYECNLLESLNLSKFNTENVTNMGYMFYDCYSLKELDLSNFNTKKVTNMYAIFKGCKSLLSLNLSKFNTKNVTNYVFNV